MNAYNKIVSCVAFSILSLGLVLPLSAIGGQVTILDPQTGDLKTYTRTDTGNTSTYWDNETGDWEVVDRTGKTIMDSDGEMYFYQSDDPDWYYKDSESEPGWRQDWPGFKQESE
jgi:hypothetical protein